MAEREGFEPPVPFGITGFQDQLHKPLGHLSVFKRGLPYAAPMLKHSARCDSHYNKYRNGCQSLLQTHFIFNYPA